MQRYVRGTTIRATECDSIDPVVEAAAIAYWKAHQIAPSKTGRGVMRTTSRLVSDGAAALARNPLEHIGKGVSNILHGSMFDDLARRLPVLGMRELVIVVNGTAVTGKLSLTSPVPASFVRAGVIPQRLRPHDLQ